MFSENGMMTAPVVTLPEYENNKLSGREKTKTARLNEKVAHYIQK